MATIVVTKRSGGGFTVLSDGSNPKYISELKYSLLSGKVKLYGPDGMVNNTDYLPAEWTVGVGTGYTTTLQVVDALDGLGLGSAGGSTNVTEASASAIKTAVEAIDNMMDGNYGNVNMNIAGSDVASGAGAVGATVPRVTLASDDPAVARLKEVAGQDFLCITDTTTHTPIDCTMIYVMSDTVFEVITVSATNVVSTKGLSAVTVPAGTMLPFGKAHATEVHLTSGSVIAYIN
jgi:hypothetical protein